jgi:hypothetical protein
MARTSITKRRLAGACRLLIVFVSCTLTAPGADQQGGPELRSSIPAGYEVVTLKPYGVNLVLMGLIECPELQGAQHVSAGIRSRVISSNGERMLSFPRHFSFRITASLRKIVVDAQPSSVRVYDDPEDLLLKLRFRIKGYHGLERRAILPESIHLIGMPAEIPYDERVFRIAVDVGEAPVTDRFVIEILTPEGEVLTHFPFNVL